jgi:hypothetical protein
MPECCGQQRTTKFCPDCGAALKVTPAIASLLAHCQVAAENADKALFAAKREHERDPDNSEKCLDDRTRIAEKWHSWADELLALVTERDELKARLAKGPERGVSNEAMSA